MNDFFTATLTLAPPHLPTLKLRVARYTKKGDVAVTKFEWQVSRTYLGNVPWKAKKKKKVLVGMTKQRISEPSHGKLREMAETCHLRFGEISSIWRATAGKSISARISARRAKMRIACDFLGPRRRWDRGGVWREGCAVNRKLGHFSLGSVEAEVGRLQVISMKQTISPTNRHLV